MPSLIELVGENPDLPAIAAHLDGLSAASRLQEVRALPRRAQARLFEAARGVRPITLADIVPPGAPPLCEVVHHGKNSLPLFTTFAKVFCRPDGPSEEVLWGYNRTRPLIGVTVGPGYFLARAGEPGEVLIDYLAVPPRKPQGWPEILPNSARLSRLVYYKTQDILRGVSRHVTIGRATREGRPMDAWFVLCRED
jgi:hypothetical protein